MSFTDHKITQFVHKIVDLPDQPNLPADELKARFDSSPEELRQAHNALCDDADRLDTRVNGIIAETFGDSISKSMLSDELAEEIDAKATQTALAAEVETLEAADAALDTRLDTVETALPQKAECYFGTYNADGAASQFINLGFTPQAVLVLPVSAYFTGPYAIYSAMAMENTPSIYGGNTVLQIEQNGFRVHNHSGDPSTSICLNMSGAYFYLAFR